MSAGTNQCNFTTEYFLLVGVRPLWLSFAANHCLPFQERTWSMKTKVCQHLILSKLQHGARLCWFLGKMTKKVTFRVRLRRKWLVYEMTKKVICWVRWRRKVLYVWDDEATCKSEMMKWYAWVSWRSELLGDVTKWLDVWDDKVVFMGGLTHWLAGSGRGRDDKVTCLRRWQSDLLEEMTKWFSGWDDKKSGWMLNGRMASLLRRFEMVMWRLIENGDRSFYDNLKLFTLMLPVLEASAFSWSKLHTH